MKTVFVVALVIMCFVAYTNQQNVTGSDGEITGESLVKELLPTQNVTNSDGEKTRESLVKELLPTDDFEAKLAEAGNKLVILNFSATRCRYSRQIAPEVEKKANEWKEKVVFFRADFDENEDLRKVYGIKSMPSFVFFKNANATKIDSCSGSDIQEVEKRIKQHLSQ